MIKTMKKAAQAGGKIHLSYFNKKYQVNYKGSHHILVTEADKKCQTTIIKTIRSELQKKGFNRSEIGFIAEENHFSNGKHLFIIDPLDGTSNFAANIPYFAISIAYYHDQEIKAGVIYDPVNNSYYWAEKGKKAYKKTSGKIKRLNVNYHPLNKCMFTTFISANPKRAKMAINKISQLGSHVLGIRTYGAATLDNVYFCENKFNIILHPKAALWDIAAGHIIVRESGGTMTDWKGNDINFDLNKLGYDYNTLACHPKLLPQVLSKINN